MNRRLSIIVAALNEEENLEPAVHAISQAFGILGIDYEILLFDDKSTDATGSVADALAAANPRIRAFHNPRRLNIGGIYKAGIREARHDYCLLLPGDNEVDVTQVARGVPLLERADLVVSYTVNPESRRQLRRVLSRAYVTLVNLLFGTEFTYTNGSNICRTDLLHSITIRTDGFSYQTEALVKLVARGVDYAEFGIEIRPRASGRSTALALRNWNEVAKALALLWWEVRIVGRHSRARRGRKITRPVSSQVHAPDAHAG